eukprot:760222-Hanusia_phi.AAC.3
MRSLQPPCLLFPPPLFYLSAVVLDLNGGMKTSRLACKISTSVRCFTSRHFVASNLLHYPH